MDSLGKIMSIKVLKFAAQRKKPSNEYQVQDNRSRSELSLWAMCYSLACRCVCVCLSVCLRVCVAVCLSVCVLGCLQSLKNLEV